jgi:hypothetical protein
MAKAKLGHHLKNFESSSFDPDLFEDITEAYFLNFRPWGIDSRAR